MKIKKILPLGCAFAVLGTALMFAACNGDGGNGKTENNQNNDFRTDRVAVPDKVRLETITDEADIAEILNSIDRAPAGEYFNLSEVYLQEYSKKTETVEMPSGGSFSSDEESFYEQKSKAGIDTQTDRGDIIEQNVVGSPMAKVFLVMEQHVRDDVKYTWSGSTVSSSLYGLEGGYVEINDNGGDAVQPHEFTANCRTVSDFLNPDIQNADTVTDLVFKVDTAVQPKKIYMSFVVTDNDDGISETREMYYDFEPGFTNHDFGSVQLPEKYDNNIRYFTPQSGTDFLKELEGGGRVVLQSAGNGPVSPTGVRAKGVLYAGGYSADMEFTYSSGSVVISSEEYTNAMASLREQAVAEGKDISSEKCSLYIYITYINTDCRTWSFDDDIEYYDGSYMYRGDYFYTVDLSR